MAEKTVPTPSPQGEVIPAKEETRAREQYVAPPVDIYETSEGLTVLADLPGVRKEDLNVEVKDDILTIQAHAHDRLPGDLVYREFELVSFFRQFQLSDRVDVAKITAEFKHGVLTLRLPKAEELKPKQIAVQVG